MIFDRMATIIPEKGEIVKSPGEKEGDGGPIEGAASGPSPPKKFFPPA